MAAERKLTNEHFTEARELVQRGITKTALCEHFGVAQETMERFLGRHNLKCNPKRYKAPNWIVAAMMNWGYSRAEMADALGLAIPTIAKRLAEVRSEIAGFNLQASTITPGQRLDAIMTPRVMFDEPKRLFQVSIPQIGAKFAVMASNQEEALEYIRGIVKVEEVAPLQVTTP